MYQRDYARIKSKCQHPPRAFEVFFCIRSNSPPMLFSPVQIYHVLEKLEIKCPTLKIEPHDSIQKLKISTQHLLYILTRNTNCLTKLRKRYRY